MTDGLEVAKRVHDPLHGRAVFLKLRAGVGGQDHGAGIDRDRRLPGELSIGLDRFSTHAPTSAYRVLEADRERAFR